MSVVSLSGDGKPIDEPNKAAIKLLEDMLERAKSGDVVGVGIAALHNDMSASWWLCGTAGTYGMLGACDMIKYEVMGILQN